LHSDLKQRVALRLRFVLDLVQRGPEASPALSLAGGSVLPLAILILADRPLATDLLRLGTAAGGLLVAQALVGNILPGSSPDPPSRASRHVEARGSGTHAGHVSAAATEEFDTEAAQPIHPLFDMDSGIDPAQELLQIARLLARRICELLGAEAAWVFRLQEGGQGVSLLSSHLQPLASGGDGPQSTARRIADSCVRSHCGRTKAERPSVREAGSEYMAIPLTRRGRWLGVLVARCPSGPREASHMEMELLSSLLSQTALALENSLLWEAQKDVDAKLRQFALHRADYGSTLSHELRTPLTSIKGFAQLLHREKEPSPDTVHRYAGTIATEADRLAMIVRDIVELSRMETGLLQMRRRPALLNRLLARAIARVRSVAPERTLVTSVPDRLPVVRVDPDRLDRVLERLLLDALAQSIPSGTMLVAAQAGDDEVTVRVEYRATQHQMERMVRALRGPGKLAEQGLPTQLGRDGLGLYICRNYIEAHGGKMWIEQPEEQLVRLVFTLPL